MAKAAPGFADNKGNLHPTPEAAVLADLTMILGRIGAESGITAGLAQIILEKREEITAAFRDLDLLTGKAATPIATVGGEHVSAAA